MHDSYLDLPKPPYFTAIVLSTFCWFKPHPFASSKAVLYTKRDCFEINIFPVSTITVVLQRENKSCFIFLGALQSPWHLYEMRLKRHAPLKKTTNFSVTHWVIESLQAQWPALVKNVSRVHPISTGKKKRIQHGEIQLSYYVLHNLLIPKHLEVRGFSVPLHNVCIFIGSHHWVFGVHIFSAFVSDVFNINYLPLRETQLWMLALVFKEHLVYA